MKTPPKSRKTRKGSSLRRMVGPLAKSVERREGAVELLKISISAMNRVLVAKGVCTEDELREAFRAESEKRPNGAVSNGGSL
jgi:hypothetical protein